MLKPMWTRRQFGLLTAGLFAPRTLLARPVSASDRKFLFIFNDGGWDTGHVFTPYWDIHGAMMEPEAAAASANGISFIDHPDRPSVRQFFETWGGQTAVLNGMEVRSITHERCRELVLTGQGPLKDDWASVIAGNATSDLLLPHVILDGPAFTSQYTSGVVRVGDADQLPELLSGSALLSSDLDVVPLTANAEAKADAFVARRAAAAGGSFGQAYNEALDRIQLLRETSALDLAVADAGCERHIANDCALAFDLFSRGLSRCSMLRYRGWCAEGWDTHQGLELQSRNFEDLFAYLNSALADLAGRTSHTGNPLADEVTIVVFSEMGREPRLNAWEGRDHWTFTSAMLIGSGINGGRTVGSLDESGQGLPIDLSSGDLYTNGTPVVPEHLGATLMELADIDPRPFIDNAQAIRGLMR